MNRIKISGWVDEDAGYFSYRYILGTNPHDVQNRVAAIEKTPRVRVSKLTDEDNIWKEGFKGSDFGMDKNSRKWCDKKLVKLGYKF